MSPFLLIIFSIYGSMHIYAYVKARSVFSFGLLSSVLIVLFLIAMVVSPIMVRLAEREGLEKIARFVAVVGYSWMGLIFLFCCISLLFDLYRALLYMAGIATHEDLTQYAISPSSTFALSWLLALSSSVYGYFEAQTIRVERAQVATDKIPVGTSRLKIVQISDVHVGLLVREERLRKIIATIREAEPDILVSTGDLVDGQLDGISELAPLIADIQPRYGKYAVTGNHEYYAGINSALEFTRQAGFRLLHGDAVEAAPGIVVAGIDDPVSARFKAFRPTSEQELLRSISRKKYILFLKHRPVVAKESSGLFDLQLSGHVHKGQIFPFNALTHLAYPVAMGLSKLGDGALLYVSRGTGTWGPPIRFLAPPEITIIEMSNP